MMVSELLWLEMVLKSVTGLLLLSFPRTLALVFGLPQVTETFWPRMLGLTLVGLAAATLLEEQLAARNGLGLAGHVVLNLGAALTIIVLLILGRAGTVRRGRFLLGLVAAALSVLGLVELAWA